MTTIKCFKFFNTNSSISRAEKRNDRWQSTGHCNSTESYTNFFVFYVDIHDANEYTTFLFRGHLIYIMYKKADSVRVHIL